MLTSAVRVLGVGKRARKEGICQDRCAITDPGADILKRI